MKKISKRLGLFAISIIVFAACTAYGANNKKQVIVYSDGYIEGGSIRTMNITSHYGFTDKGRDGGVYNASFGIPENDKVELRVKAKTEGNDEIFISFRDLEGNIIFEEKSNSIFFSKTIDAKKGEWYFQIDAQNVKTGDFKYIILKK